MEHETNKVAVVTGGARGIGQALAIGLADAGHDVAILDLPSNKTGLSETKEIITGKGKKSWTISTDITSKEEVDSAFREIFRYAGHIDVLVNNAGILHLCALENLSEDEWDVHVNVNVRGGLFACQCVLPSMRKRRFGRIINIASIAGRLGVPNQGHYAATKAAVISLTRVMAREAGEDGITVNAICPGIILTEMGKNNLGDEEAIRNWEQVTALKRLGQPEDVVGPVCFFASDMSSFVTGQALNVCGGIYFD